MRCFHRPWPWYHAEWFYLCILAFYIRYVQPFWALLYGIRLTCLNRTQQSLWYAMVRLSRSIRHYHCSQHVRACLAVYVHALKTGCVVLAHWGHAPRNRSHIGWVECFLNEQGFLLPLYSVVMYAAHALEQRPLFVRVMDSWGLRLFKSACCFKSPRNSQLCTGKKKNAIWELPFGVFMVLLSLQR